MVMERRTEREREREREILVKSRDLEDVSVCVVNYISCEK